MRRLLFLLLLAPMGAGCVDMDFKLRDTPPRPVTPISAITTPISADQVTPDNGRRMAQALWDEIEREDLAAPAPETRKK